MENNFYHNILAALCTAIIVIFSQISIPIGTVPITLQVFAIALVGFSIKRIQAILSVVTYILLGIIGIPVFTGFNSGLSVFAGATGGFIIGFIFLIFFCSLSTEKHKLLSIVGLVSCHLCGIVWFMIIYSQSFMSAFIITSAPFILKDLLLLYIADRISKKIRPLIEKI